MKIAVASQNQRVVHQHFGHATQFLIYKDEGQECRLIEIRSNDPACGTAKEADEEDHADSALQHSVDLISDCGAVVVAHIGPEAVRLLSYKGIRAFAIPDFIDSALRRLKESGQLDKPVQPGETRFSWLDPR